MIWKCLSQGYCVGGWQQAILFLVSSACSSFEMITLSGLSPFDEINLKD
jgi:hypothetical protein